MVQNSSANTAPWRRSLSSSRLTETTVPDNLAPKTHIVSRARFRSVRCAAYRVNFAGLGGGESEDLALCVPVMREVLGKHIAITNRKALEKRSNGTYLPADYR